MHRGRVARRETQIAREARKEMDALAWERAKSKEMELGFAECVHCLCSELMADLMQMEWHELCGVMIGYRRMFDMMVRAQFSPWLLAQKT